MAQAANRPDLFNAVAIDQRTDARLDHSPLWRVRSYEYHQRVPPRGSYWWDNRARKPIGDCVFQYTLAGAMTYETGGVDHLVPVGHAVIYVNGEDSAYGLRPDAIQRYECRYILLQGAGLAEHWRALQRSGGPIIACSAEGSLLTRLAEAITAREESGDPLVVAAAVQNFVLALYAQYRRSRLQRLSPAELAVERILSMPHYPWSLKELATEHGCSREHLLRIFRARAGEPPATWLRRMRLARALDLLRDTDLPIVDVARQSGFTSPHTLARLIRSDYGCAPSDLRDGSKS